MLCIQYYLVVIFLNLFITGGYGTFSTNYRYTSELHPNSYSLYWNPPTEDGEICFAVSVRTSGWVGLGFSPNGGMLNSDVVMGWVKNGETFFTDRFASERALPSVDAVQDYRLVSGEEQNGNTSFEFCRKLKTCDDRDRDLAVGTTRVIYSWNPEDPDETPLQHVTRGSKSLNLLSEPSFTPSLPTDTQTISLLIDNLTIPSEDTTYWCNTFPFQQPANKRHIIRVGIQLDPTSSVYVHHIVLYICDTQLPSLAGRCSRDSASQFDICKSKIIAGWAIGGADFDYPPEAGLPIGPEETFRTFMLEIHYNNPNEVSGVVDSSGLVLYHTGELRQYDAGILVIGQIVSPDMVIPPFAESYIVQGYCPSECTREILNTTDIQVFSSFLHSHLAGRSMWTQHIRDGQEIGTVDRNMDYDFNFQDQIAFNPHITIKPGDELIVNCQYNTVDRQNYTYGGESTREEMCLHFLTYYPRVNLNVCVSQYLLPNSYKAANESLICDGVIDENTSILDASQVNWGDKVHRTLEVSALARNNTVFAFCNKPIITKMPIPGVDYEILQNRWDECDNYNGTYYVGQNQDYYRCGEAPYVPSISFAATDAGALHSLLTSLLVISLLVQALNTFV